MTYSSFHDYIVLIGKIVQILPTSYHIFYAMLYVIWGIYFFTNMAHDAFTSLHAIAWIITTYKKNNTMSFLLYFECMLL